MQVEALQVVHADDEQVRDELEAVGETLHEAMGTVRASVHDLHDDAFDLRAQLQRAIAACGLPDVRLTFDARDVPLPVAYGLLSVVREALSNVAKHSDATRVDVSVIEYPALYQLVVQDNGTTAAGSGRRFRLFAGHRSAYHGGAHRCAWRQGCAQSIARGSACSLPSRKNSKGRTGNEQDQNGGGR